MIPADAIFRFTTAVRHDAAIDAWLSTRRPGLRELTTDWFTCMRACGDEVCELMHDGRPTACFGDAAFGYVDAFANHVNVGFFFGAQLPDPARLLVGTGRLGRHVKLQPGRPVDVAALAALVSAAYLDIQGRF